MGVRSTYPVNDCDDSCIMGSGKKDSGRFVTENPETKAERKLKLRATP